MDIDKSTSSCDNQMIDMLTTIITKEKVIIMGKTGLFIGLVIILAAVFIYYGGMSKTPAKGSVSPSEVKQKLDNKEDVVIIDVRTEEEYRTGHLPGSILIPVDRLSKNITNKVPDKDEEIIVYCRSGNRSRTAWKTLTQMGYTNVYDMGGINKWPYSVEK